MNHISARVAWHKDGWNGHICNNPSTNTYCVGPYSYPGTTVKDHRDLAWEEANKGKCAAKLDRIPACIHSMNAFGSEELIAFADPPDFFKDGTLKREWTLPPSTVCIWPYELMYDDSMKKEGGGYDHEGRLQEARAYFKRIADDPGLIFYYSNYSNPFSEDDQKRYVVVGVSRIKEVGEELFYENCSPEVKARFGGGYVWLRNITSHYPNEGFRIPYHLYMDNPEAIEKMLITAENPYNFKYATRPISDDDALTLVEQFLEVVNSLKEIGDKSEDWSLRLAWLQSLMTDLWSSRGLFPGLPKVLDYLKFGEAIPFLRNEVLAGNEKIVKSALFSFLDGDLSEIQGLSISSDQVKRIRRQWQLKEDDERYLLREILPRFDLRIERSSAKRATNHIEQIMMPTRAEYGIYASLKDIAENPYILSESFVGSKTDDTIQFHKIDHGMFPSPELGGDMLTEVDDGSRLRALCVDRLKRENKHTFMSVDQIIYDVNHKLSFLPDWKRCQFNPQYLKVDKDHLKQALIFRKSEEQEYAYLKTVFEDERTIEEQIRFLARGSDIIFKSPVTENHWHDYLYNSQSSIAHKNPGEYEKAINGQIEVCQKIFVRPISVLSGEAGTGKTTVIKAIIQAIEKAHGSGTSFCLLAPTGKAADRIREATGKQALTIHSFLAAHGWLNDNLTFKRIGGSREDGYTTYIIDEASMLDLELAATLFKSIKWSSVQRLIFVGDPNQLPPIGRGRVFADIIDWLRESQQESIGRLPNNIRQMENRLGDAGTGILDLASIYVRTWENNIKNEALTSNAEIMLKRAQEGGDIDKDLRVIYWSDMDDLELKLINSVISDMEMDTGVSFDVDRAYELWNAAFKDEGYKKRPEYMQVISPYRGEQFGIENLNKILQNRFNGKQLERIGELGGVTLNDKIIQVLNRPKSNPVKAYNTELRKPEKVEVYNGEIGFAEPALQDLKRNNNGKVPLQLPWFTLKRFQAVFSRKPHLRISVESSNFVDENMELAYAISVHKSQGSEFDRVYFVLPKSKTALLSRELFYTGITRARKHCTLFVEQDISPLLSMRRLEKSQLLTINSSLFKFQPMPKEIQNMHEWYREGKIHHALADIMVRSKSEVIIANMLFERDIPFTYEMPLYAADGTFYLPDFTVTWRGEDWYWEHLGLMDSEEYRNHWETKKAWYDRFFPGKLITTEESGNLSMEAHEIITRSFS